MFKLPLELSIFNVTYASKPSAFFLEAISPFIAFVHQNSHNVVLPSRVDSVLSRFHWLIIWVRLTSRIFTKLSYVICLHLYLKKIPLNVTTGNTHRLPSAAEMKQNSQLQRENGCWSQKRHVTMIVWKIR